MNVMVLGAGIVGISTAVHLLQRGVNVILVDQDKPAMGATYGNAGMIHGEAAIPLSFPRDIRSIIKFGCNRTAALHYHLRALPEFAGFLGSYWWHSEPGRLLRLAEGYAALTARSLSEHRSLAELAGVSSLLKANGCFSIYRSRDGWKEGIKEAEQAQEHFDIRYNLLDPASFKQKEPEISGIIGAVHWIDSITVSDPFDVANGYFKYFEKLGGKFINGNTGNIISEENGWSLRSDGEIFSAQKIIVALGARSNLFTRSLGYSFPLMPKRGYHLHYRTAESGPLNHTLIDRINGFSLAPMTNGIRLTTGIEFANLDAPKTPVQMLRAENSARKMFKLGSTVETTPWMGERPCTPDMLPVIGRAPDRDDVWFAFGHGHQGFTMGPVTGRLVAETMTGDKPVIDPAPYRPERFLT